MQELTPQLIDFIKEHANDEPSKLALQANKYPDIPIAFAIDQIRGRKKAKSKLPTWYAHEEITYPSKLSMEQCSSETTAQFKASLFQGNTLLDLTGGFGVDTAFLANSFSKVHHIERDKLLSEIAQHNFNTLQLSHIATHIGNGLDFLNNYQENIDLIYIDPARRDEQQQKVIAIDAYQPDIIPVAEQLVEKSKNVLVKVSPMTDIKQSIRQLKYVSDVWVVAVQNECREVLFGLKKDADGIDPLIHCVNLQADGQQHLFQARLSNEEQAQISLSLPLKYVYEPHVAILKGGLFNSLVDTFQVAKLHPHSHLYTSDEPIDDFPGRHFICKEFFKYNRKALAKKLPQKKANITTRNFPISVAEIRKKTGIKEGGDIYLFACLNAQEEKIIIWCEKVH